ncbi:MAG: hypothetical protein QXX77_07870 [Candidatus Methanosuratincola sp.]|jgi:hypothetical protein
MKPVSLTSILIPILLSLSCDTSDLIPATGEVGPKVTEQDALTQSYDLVTPTFGMRVAIREDVGGEPQDILSSLDEGAADFLECQFQMDPNLIATIPFEIPSGEEVPPLSQLRVFVVSFTFECDAVDRTECAGIYYPSSDVLIISKESLGQCKEFPFWKHELGHRYGMALDHSNQREFEPCIDPPGCDGLPFGIGD